MEEDSDNMSYEDLTGLNNIQINALIELLKKKKLITQDEFDKKVTELYSDEEEHIK